MAFCTSCGAQVSGAFCNQCGTPVRASGGQAPPTQPMSAPPMAQGGVMPPPVARKTNPIVWVLVAVLGVFILGFVFLVGGSLFVAHRIARNPAAAAARLAAMASRHVDVVSTDDNAGTITLRDRRTGKIVTMSFDQAKNGRFSFSAEGDDGKMATVEFGDGKVPSWVPSYPGSSPRMNVSAKGDSDNEIGEGGNFTFTTSDAASRVLQFYQDKAKDLGMDVKLTTTTSDAGMVIASDEASRRSLTAIIGRDGGMTTVNVTYGAKR